jgi:glycerophosphoryl diester phosphodiesterase
MNKKLIIAHRGSTEMAPESTLLAFEAAIKCHADMIELDIRKTSDGIFITYHNESIKNIPVNRLPYKEVFRFGYDQGIEIPVFEDVLKCTRDKIKLDIEIKESGDENEIIEIVRKYFKSEDFIITSFIQSTLSRIKKIDPQVRVGLILGGKKATNQLKTLISEFLPFKRCKDAGIDMVVPHWKLLRFGFLKRARKFNFPVIVWTVNEKNQILKFIRDKHITGIITDKPELVIALVQKAF